MHNSLGKRRKPQVCIKRSSCRISRHVALSAILLYSQDCDVPEDTLQRLIQYIAHLVLEILRRHDWIEQMPPEDAFKSDDLPTRATNRRIYVESFPEVIDGVRTGLGADVKENADAKVDSLDDVEMHTQ